MQPIVPFTFVTYTELIGNEHHRSYSVRRI